jgi:hypothetical protein
VGSSASRLCSAASFARAFKEKVTGLEASIKEKMSVLKDANSPLLL